MESINAASRLRALAGKYKHAILVLLIGLGLMLLPTGSKDTAPTETEPVSETEPAVEADLETRLAQILSKISGAGKVEVLLTVRTGGETLYQTDGESEASGESSRQSTGTVIIENENHQESGLVRRTDPPVYLGAVVVCQGADNPSVKLAVVEAVKCVTGLGADQITVVKME